MIKILFLLSTLALTAQAQTYPSRIGNYCLSDAAAVTASSSAPGYAASGAIDGDRVGQHCAYAPLNCWTINGGWNDATRDAYPDWLRVDFGRPHSVGRIVVVTFQDNFSTPRIEPYLGLQVGNNYTIETFTVEVLNTSGAWVQVGEAEENIDIIREYTFAPVVGTAIRIIITEAYAHYSRVVEFEAYAV